MTCGLCGFAHMASLTYRYWKTMQLHRATVLLGLPGKYVVDLFGLYGLCIVDRPSLPPINLLIKATPDNIPEGLFGWPYIIGWILKFISMRKSTRISKTILKKPSAEGSGKARGRERFVLCDNTATAKSLQSCPTRCDPIDSSPPGSPNPGILQARTLERVAISFSNAWKWKVKVKSLSRVRLLATPWTAAYQAPLSMGFSRQEYWSGVPLPSPCVIIESFKERMLKLCHFGLGMVKKLLVVVSPPIYLIF